MGRKKYSKELKARIALDAIKRGFYPRLKPLTGSDQVHLRVESEIGSCPVVSTKSFTFTCTPFVVAWIKNLDY